VKLSNSPNGNLKRNITEITELAHKQNNTFVDIGASNGWYSEASHRVGFSNIYSFEPRTDTELQQRCSPYSIINQCAVSDYEGLSDFYHVPKNPNISSLARPFGRHGQAQHFDIISVPVRPLDSFNIENIDLIKIDVEGNELAVLKGAVNTLQNNSVALIIEMSRDHNKILKFLKELNYEPCGFHWHTDVFPISNDLTFDNYREKVVWNVSNTSFDPRDSKKYVREHLQDRDKYDYNSHYPIWGDFIFKTNKGT
jgi:FkbM family methyltransferase